MQLPAQSFRPMPWFARLLAMVAIVAFLVIGVLGLVLPVIPGVLFLFLAALLATRVSRRASDLAHRQPWFREQLRAWQSSDGLSTGHRLKLSFLVALRTLVSGIAKGARFLRQAWTK